MKTGKKVNTEKKNKKIEIKIEIQRENLEMGKKASAPYTGRCRSKTAHALA